MLLFGGHVRLRRNEMENKSTEIMLTTHLVIDSLNNRNIFYSTLH